jgi:putative ABC transport system permease protein
MVSGVTIFIVIFIATTARKKQIGIMKAVGMKDEIVILSYVMLAFFYALLGICLGIILLELVFKPYFAANPLIFPIGKVPLTTNPAELILSIVSMLIVSLIAGFIPSWRIARQNIIKAIWG